MRGIIDWTVVVRLLSNQHAIRDFAIRQQNANYYACSPISIVLPDVGSRFRAGRLSLTGSGMYRHVASPGIAGQHLFRETRSTTMSPTDAIRTVCIVASWMHIAAARMLLTQPSKSSPASVREGGRHRKTNPARDREPIFGTRKIKSAGFAAKSQISLTADQHFLRRLGVSRAMTREGPSIYTS
jgi:hypothetical protein